MFAQQWKKTLRSLTEKRASWSSSAKPPEEEESQKKQEHGDHSE